MTATEAIRTINTVVNRLNDPEPLDAAAKDAIVNDLCEVTAALIAEGITFGRPRQ